MAFPTVESITVTTNASSADPQTINMPATVNAGDLLLMLLGINNKTAATPTDWAALGGDVKSAAFAKVAVGDEDGGTVSVDYDGATPLAAQVYRISGWYGAIAGVEAGTIATGGDQDPNCPSLTVTWGSADNLWIAFAGARNDDVHMVVAPANYTDLTSTISGGGENAACEVGSSRRELAADTDDPGVQSSAYTPAQFWSANTIGIRPAAAGGANAPTGNINGPLVGALGGPL